MSPASHRACAYVDWVLRRGGVIWLVTLLLTTATAAGTWASFRGLRSDLESLLPDRAPSVVALRELRTRMAGIRVLGVVVDAGRQEDLGAAERLIDDLAARIRTYPPELVASVRKDVVAERAFIEEHAALYAELPDLVELRQRLEARKEWEAAEAAGANLDDEPAPSVDVSDLEQRYRRRDPTAGLAKSGRMTNAGERLTVLLVDVPGYATGTGAYEDLMGRIRAELASLGGTQSYGPSMRLGFAGAPALAVEELRSLQGDLTLSSLIVAIAILLVLLAYFRWWPSVIVISLPLGVAVCAAFALARMPPFRVTELNANTAFLGSIIVGNGVNFGIILLARYLEERRKGGSVRDALAVSVSCTRAATITAAAAAAIAYGSLATTSFRGFWQFGVIGGVGMMICWGASFLLTPPLIAAFDRGGPLRAPRRIAFSPTMLLASAVTRFPRSIVGAGVVLIAMALVGSRSFGLDRLDTDFSKLRRQDRSDNGARYWGERMERVLGKNITPIAMLTDSREETLQVAALVRERRDEDPELREAIDRVRTFADRIPQDQEAKLQEVRRIREVITPFVRSRIPPERMARVDKMLGEGALRAVGAGDIPTSILTGVLELDGSVDKVVLVHPGPGQQRWRGTSLMALAAGLREVAAEAPGADGRPARIAGQMPLSADITASVFADAPKAITAALIGVLVLVFATFRMRRETLLVLGALLAGVLWLVWATMLGDIELNFINFVAFPIAFGIGVDYAVNVAWRYKLDGSEDAGAAIRSTGGAVGLCSLTTVIGYSSLLLAENRGLYSFGLVSVIGEVTCLVAAVVLVPAVLMVTRSRHPLRPGRGQAPATDRVVTGK